MVVLKVKKTVQSSENVINDFFIVKPGCPATIFYSLLCHNPAGR